MEKSNNISCNSLTEGLKDKISEFETYDSSVITKCIIEYIEGSSISSPEELLFSMLSGFSKMYYEFNSSHSKKENEGYKIANPYENLIEKYNDLNLSSSCKVFELLSKLSIDYDKLINSFNSANEKRIDLVLVENCVNSYYDLVRKTVFYIDNTNLLNDNFRYSEYLKDLVIPNRTDHSISEDSKINLGYNVSFIDAYNLDTILLIIKNAVLLKNHLISTNDNTDHLKELRLSLICSMADRAFGRYINLDGETYRITMNRQTSKIVARPFSNRSSLMSIKPIRLFDKIQSFLQIWFNNYNSESDNLKFKISIIGHCEKSWLLDSPEEVEVNDLFLAISNWVEKEYSNFNGHINIKYYVNIADWYTCAGKERKVITNSSPKCSFTIEKISYVNNFSFSSKIIENIVNESDMTFVLDPAFLYTENYDLGTNFSLYHYCEALNTQDPYDRAKQLSSGRIDSVDRISSQTDMMFLNAQLNRVMASKTMDAGSICRVFNDNVIKVFKNAVQKKSGKPSVVYIFSSETFGLTKSDEYSHPLVRVEQYNGKTVNIFQYCNYSVPRLIYNNSMDCLDNSSINFTIPFWSTIKYISLNYVFLYAKDWVNVVRNVTKTSATLTPYDLLSIFKYIYTVISIRPSKNGQYDIAYNVNIDDRIKDDIFRNNFNANQISCAIYQKAKKTITELFENVIFKEQPIDNPVFGNELIKIGFSMNVYSAIKTVDGIYFWFNYHKAIKSNKFDRFHIHAQFDTCLKNTDQIYINNERKSDKSRDCFFMDKRIYALMLEQLNQQKHTNSAFNSMIIKLTMKPYHQNINDPVLGLGYYEDNNNNSINSIPNALLLACQKLGDTDTELYYRIVDWIKDNQ